MYKGDDDEYTEWFSGVRSRHYWIRGGLMLLFYLVLWFVRFIVLFLALFQFGAAMIVGRPNQRVTPFARQLGAYMQQLVEFVTWASEHRPYPLSPWPGGAGDGEAGEKPEPPASWETEEESEPPFEPEPEPAEPFEPEPQAGEEEDEIEPEPAPSEKPARSRKPSKSRSSKASSKAAGEKAAGKAEESGGNGDSEDEDDTPPRPDA